MPVKPIVLPGGGIGQAASRYLDTFTDQHRFGPYPDGRPWWGYREFASMRGNPDGFVGSVTPGDHRTPTVPAWSAPWLPEEKYFEFNYRKAAITIRYDRMEADDRRAYEDYYRAANTIELEKSWTETPFGAVPRFAIRAMIGPPPRSPKIAQAARAGDRWLIGATPEVNESLAVLLGMTRGGLKLEQAEPNPIATPSDVISMTKDELAKFIAAEVAKLQAATPEKPRRKHRRTRPLPDVTPDSQAA